MIIYILSLNGNVIITEEANLSILEAHLTNLL